MQVVAEVYQTDGKVREGQQAIITSRIISQSTTWNRSLGLQVIKQEITSGEPEKISIAR